MFVVIWLLGDLASLSGAIIAGLLPTVIILALYVSTLDSQVVHMGYSRPPIGIYLPPP